MSVLVTGGSGFIGVNIVKKLAERGMEVVSFSRSGFDKGFDNFIGTGLHYVHIVKADILDIEEIQKAIRKYGVKIFIHNAAMSPTLAYLERPAGRQTVQINIVGTVNALEAAVAEKVDRFVYVSSAMVYGRRDPNQALSEDILLKPNTIYPITKFASELLSLRYGELYDQMDVRIVRISSIYGPMERPTTTRLVPSPIYDCCVAAISAKNVEIADLDAQRDFTYVDDTVEGILLVSLTPETKHKIYNIAYGKLFSFSEVVNTVKKLEPEFRFTVASQKEKEGYLQIPIRGPLDITLARTELGFEPRYDLEKGLKTYLEWLRINSMHCR
jgi:UDP-glucose 4-epimerase